MSQYYNRGKPAHPYSGCRVRVRKKHQDTSGIEVVDGGYLIHYGISGQKWGIRRYQNEDGTLTEEGKERYREDGPESNTWKKSEARYLSDKELIRRNNRLAQERTYREALTTESERNAKQIKNDIIKKVIAGTAISLAVVAMRGHWKQAASFISKFAKRKFAPYRAASMLKNTLKKYPNVPERVGPMKEILGKHVGRVL